MTMCMAPSLTFPLAVLNYHNFCTFPNRCVSEAAFSCSRVQKATVNAHLLRVMLRFGLRLDALATFQAYLNLTTPKTCRGATALG
jgi:hypothetical protein